LCSVGWDWVPPARDRNIGIWLPVYLRTTGGVTIGNARIDTEFKAGQDTSAAKVSVSLSLFNHTGSEETGKLNVSIVPGNFNGRSIQFTKVVTAGEGATTISFSPSNTGALNIDRPAVWWPNGYGKPNLYRIRLQYSNNAGLSDDTTFLFGIRTISTKAVQVNGSWRRDFYMNGRRLHLTGGAWVPDFMLNRDSLRYDYEMRFCRNANINLVRIWGGGVTPCDEFFEAADRYGLMVWSDFWITGDTQGEFKGSPDWPFDSGIFKKNVESTILRVRNHPCLLVWTGGNEGNARKELYDFMRNSIISLDGTRPFIPSSSGFAGLPVGWPASWPDNLPGGVYSGGPYTWQDPKSYYTRADAGKDWVFKDETGIPSQPPYNILPKIIPDLVWDKTLPFPLNNVWGYHDACSGNGHWEMYYSEMVKRYGEPESMKDFCDKMQLMNAIGYQGIFEAAGHKLNDIGGVMLWKINAAFPSVVWQVYDWFLQPNAGYYFMQNACEPVHIQLNLITNKVTVLNRSYNQVPGLVSVTDVYTIDSRRLFHEEAKTSLGPTEVKETTSIEKILGETKGVAFVILNLKDASGKVISHNIYWLASDGDYRSMKAMPETRVTMNVMKEEKGMNDKIWTLEVSNKTDRLAFFINPRVMVGGEDVLPAYWSENYFSLAPGESTSVTVTCPLAALKGESPVLNISGWNVEAVETDLLKK
ncbi:MAG: glycoside hydrolase family 2 protein, partial [Bacteroidales bacterium]